MGACVDIKDKPCDYRSLAKVEVEDPKLKESFMEEEIINKIISVLQDKEFGHSYKLPFYREYNVYMFQHRIELHYRFNWKLQNVVHKIKIVDYDKKRSSILKVPLVLRRELYLLIKQIFNENSVKEEFYQKITQEKY